MATRQRDSSNRASSKQQRGLLITPTPGPIAASSPQPASTSLAAHPTGTREQRIAISAYLRAAGRGFTPGHELEDWLAAERALDASEFGPASPRQ